MGSRLRENPSKIFEVFVEVARAGDENGEPFVLQRFPDTYLDKEVMKSIPQFVFPCDFECPNVDHFTFVLTDIESKYRFGFCRYATRAETCLCLISYLPWYEEFYKLLNHLADVLNSTENNNVEPLLTAALTHSVPAPGKHLKIISACNKQSFIFTAPVPSKLPTVPENRNLTEYYTAVDPHNMMVIFASMLYERRILITSKRMSRLTACVHGSASLLYPMYWQHLYIPVLPAHLLDYCSAPMPFLIGIHSNLMKKVRTNELGDVVILDADNNAISTEYDDLSTLPQEVVSSLKKRLKGQQADKVKSDTGLAGDGVARAFLKALVALIGGYRDALKFRQGEQITFDKEAFLISRPPSIQPFLEKILQLQIFEQFIADRLDLLNAGCGFTDEFEMEVNNWADKMGTSSKYKEWLTSMKKQGKKLRREGKDRWIEFTSKANPAMKSAVKTVKDKSKKAIKDFRSKIDDLKKDDELMASVVYHSGSSRTAYSLDRDGGSNLSSSLPLQLRPSRPPRPPPPDRPRTVPSHRHTTQSQQLVKTRQYKLMALDDMSIDVKEVDKLDSPTRISIGLLEDPDIQFALKKSYSVEDMISKSRAETLMEDDLTDTSSESESEGVEIFTTTENTGTWKPVAPPRRKRTNEGNDEIPRTSNNDGDDSKQFSRTTLDDPSSLSIGSDDHVPIPPPRTSSRQTHDSLLIDLNSPESESQKTLINSDAGFEDNFVVMKKAELLQAASSSSSLRSTHPPSKELNREIDGAVGKLKNLYVKLEETKDLPQEHDVGMDVQVIQAKHFGNVQRLKAMYMGLEDETIGKPPERNSSLRTSGVQRSPAFKRDSEERPNLRRASSDGIVGSSIEQFDPLLAPVNRVSSSPQPKKPAAQITPEDVNLLKDWSLNFSSLTSTGSSKVPLGPQAPSYGGQGVLQYENRSLPPNFNLSHQQSHNLSIQTRFQTPGLSSNTQIPPTFSSGFTKRPSPSTSPNIGQPSPPCFPSSPSPVSLMNAPTGVVRNDQNFLQPSNAGANVSQDPFSDLLNFGTLKSTPSQQTWEKFE